MSVHNVAASFVIATGPAGQDGFSGDTSTPAAVGDAGASGYSENVTARADFVPYQNFTGTFRIGIPAFHQEGMSYVEFSIDQGPWKRATYGTNADTGVVEYYVTCVASDYSKGLHEARARCYPVSGVPRVVSGMYFNANATVTTKYVATDGNDSTGNGTSLTPYATIGKALLAIQTAAGSVDNALIYLKAGDYSWCGLDNPAVANTTGWATVTHAPGVLRSAVRITASPTNQRTETHLIHIYDLTLTVAIAQLDNNTPSIWYDNVVQSGTGTDDVTSGFGAWNGASYCTDCTVTSVRQALAGMTLARNVIATTLGEDAFSDSLCVINCTASDIVAITGAHPDIIQNQTATTNTIWYGVTATSGLTGASVQGLSSGGNLDMAIVNCNIATGGHQFYMDARQGTGVVQNLYMLNCAFTGSGDASWSLPSNNDPPTTCTKVVVESSPTAAALLGAYTGVTYR